MFPRTTNSHWLRAETDTGWEEWGGGLPFTEAFWQLPLRRINGIFNLSHQVNVTGVSGGGGVVHLLC